MAGALQPGGSDRLVYLLGRYGEAIEWDLADRQWDMGELWRQRRWRFLLNLIEHLPGDSHYLAAVANDDELVEQAPEPKPGPPPLHTWTPEVDKLTLIADRLGEAVTAIHNTVAKRPQRPPPRLPRPQTAQDRIKTKRRREKHHLVKKRLREAAESGRPSMAAATGADSQHAAVRPGKGGTPHGTSTR
ncbi:hypothetical protein [Streptomyces sp. NPDC007063]|uniref:hypothetical protein n=1 Tax=Streptomyces sp. NPDC007063 TaxID=3364772 RepID=UPI0036B5A73B